MRHTDVYAWTLSVCASLRRSQAKTLADLVDATLAIGHATLAAIGRKLNASVTVKANIQRVWRFTANERVEPGVAMEGVIRRLLKRRKKPLIVSLDWTEHRAYDTLALMGAFRGRAVPLVWQSFWHGQFHTSRNAVQRGLLTLLKAYVPPHVPVIVLADRGFGRTELARFCQRLGLHYVIRIRPEVTICCPSFTGNLEDVPVYKGIARVLRNVEYRKHRPVTQHVAIRWKKGLPKKRDEPWFLMTDLDATAIRLTDLYAHRMTIEEAFRDQKNTRNGFALRQTQLTRPERLDRLILILTLAALLLAGLGLIARRRYRPAAWCSDNRPNTCSVFTIGRIMLTRMTASTRACFRAVLRATESIVPAWLTDLLIDRPTA